ncbi:MAG: hypothetical protein A2Y34_11120 [Spirochaetes bacterium GWC1_27_15]|nr:MAG: hypothetical protein A2Y34_11120 [Spirochaetes bacterium GWC1_27_15]
MVKITNLGYPAGTTISFTDSIPLFAIPFKIFKDVLPQNFQYFGFWILFCYILQGIFSFLLLKRISNNILIQLIGSIFFIVSPIIVARSGGHFALMGHWVILAILFVIFSNFSIKKTYFLLSFLFLLALLIHPYFLFMIFLLSFIKSLNIVIFEHKLKQTIIFYSISIVMIVFLAFLIGFFQISISQAKATGFGDYSLNLNALINPQDFSCFLKERKYAIFGQYEGFNYIGLGLIILIMLNLFFLLKNKEKLDKANIIMIVVCFIITLIATTNTITFDDKILFNIPFPDIIRDYFNIFRASGRMFWAVYYIIIFYSIFYFYNNRKYIYNEKIKIFVLFILFLIQITDFSQKYSQINKYNTTEINYQTPLQSSFWENDIKKYKKISFVPPNFKSFDYYIPFAELAYKKGLKMDLVYSARGGNDSIYTKKVIDEVLGNKLQSDTIYIIQDENILQSLQNSPNLKNIDGFYVITQM